jgi:hypothetical protein
VSGYAGALIKQSIEIKKSLGVVLSRVRVVRHDLVPQDGRGGEAMGAWEKASEHETGKQIAKGEKAEHRVLPYRISTEQNDGAKLAPS